MVMFEERPYRQQSKSFWSIWWFVGLMATGLTAWHLELIPLIHQQSAKFSSVEPDLIEQSDLPDNPIAKFAMPAEPLPQGNSEPVIDLKKLRHTEPSLSSHFVEKTKGFTKYSPDSRQNSAAKPVIQQTGYEQTIPPANSTHEEIEQPYFQSKSEFTPVQTLTYRPKTNPVLPKQIPLASTTPPVRAAIYEQQHQQNRTQNNTVFQTATLTKRTPQNPETTLTAVPNQLTQPFQLSDIAKQDILKHRQLSEQYWKQPETRQAIATELNRLAEKIYFSADVNYLPSYQVQPNDQLRQVAKAYDVPWEYLANLNQTPPEKIQAGQSLKVIKGPFNAVVDLKDFRITIHAHGYYVKSFSIGTGKDHSTPEGKFTVQNKERNPTYYGKTRTISRDDPMNPLGEHWIDLGNSYGIHGTINPLSIGQSVSKGCIRMVNSDAEQVFNLLTTKSEVLIRE